MQLKKIKRAEKKGTESVMDEKFALLFKSTFQTADIRINVRQKRGFLLLLRENCLFDFCLIFDLSGVGDVFTCGCNRSWQSGTTVMGHNNLG